MNKVKLVFGEVGQYDPSFYDARKFNEDKLLYTDKLSDSELVDELIRQSYFVMLRQISSQSVYKMLNGFFESGTFENRYRQAARLAVEQLTLLPTLIMWCLRKTCLLHVFQLTENCIFHDRRRM